MRAHRVVRRAGCISALVVSLVLLGLAPGIAKAAAPGMLDPSFGVNGIALTSFGPGVTKACALAIQADGKYVVAGMYGASATETDLTLARYNPDGSLDASFGTNGMVVGGVLTSPSSGLDMVVLPDSGDIVVSMAGPDGLIHLVRFLPNGQPDASFGTGGQVAVVVAPYVAGDSSRGGCLAAGPAGKLLLGTTLKYLRNDDFAIFRLNPDGSPDATFGADGNGRTIVDLAGDSVDNLDCLRVAPDGGIVAGGICQYSVAVVLRLKADGTRDTSFGFNGVVVAADKGAVVGVVAQPDGDTVALDGFGGAGTTMARYTPSGQLDTAFGVSGWVDVLNLAGQASPTAWLAAHKVSQIALQADGSLVLAGTQDDGFPTFNDIWITRFTSDGAYDTGFGTNGTTVTDLGGADDCAAAAIGPDGKFVVAGYALAAGARAAVGAGAGGLAVRAATTGESLVRYDTGPSLLLKGPRTFALAKVSARKGATTGFHYRANAVTKKVTVTIKVFKGSKLEATVTAGLVRASVTQVKRWHCTLPKGTYVWKVYAVDQHNKKQTSVGSNKLVVM